MSSVLGLLGYRRFLSDYGNTAAESLMELMRTDSASRAPTQDLHPLLKMQPKSHSCM